MADAPQEVDDMERLGNVQAHEDEVDEHAVEAAPQQEAGSTEPEKSDADDDENETCGFCRFMKGGGCRQTFIDWSKCVDSERDSGNDDFAEKCAGVTLALRECMLAHRDYYGPLLEEEEEMLKDEEAKRAAEAEVESGSSSGRGGGAATQQEQQLRPAGAEPL